MIIFIKLLLLLTIHLHFSLAFASSDIMESCNKNPPLSLINNQNQIICIYCNENPSFENNLIRKIKNKNVWNYEVEFKINNKIKWTNSEAISPYDFFVAWKKFKTKKSLVARRPYNYITKINVNSANNSLILTFSKPTFNMLHLRHLCPVFSRPTSQSVPNEFDLNTISMPPRQSKYFTEIIGFNFRNPLFLDKKIRHKIRDLILAASKNLDRQSYQNIINSDFFPLLDFSTTNQNSNPSFDISIQNEVKLELIYSNSQPWRQRFVEHLVKELEKYNIKIIPIAYNSLESFNNSIRKIQYHDLVLLSIEQAPYLLPIWLDSSQIPSQLNSYRGENYFAWRNLNFDKLIRSLETSVDVKSQNIIYEKMNNIIFDEVPVIPLFSWLVSLEQKQQ